ncbi:hypothetical protein MYCTH_2301876 [Thermothelomyces thermophilus ATCC 42464]|uniref:Uncharacterized protein n=1 Tax=Thermothelomyces thermophilus (strain ATCC 42464 / BCRC 31852 / DSM 1799) TaxID=573729 RepID=G2QAK0_THET4|nr:uncharacterized protein MYCTH_2301876 [Thermothelomyces thermophilus ATCC 42464]AEO56696.1 hypothetical protein MYCTH_2301876 [Thermothelomyces thermophilus ATCC 42464]
MDFWSRLLAHTPLSSANSRKDFAKDPARRLHRFEKEYSQLLVSMDCLTKNPPDRQ